jgi:hypothetical protein
VQVEYVKNPHGMLVTKSVSGIPLVKVTSGAAVPDPTPVACALNVKLWPGHEVRTVIFRISNVLRYLSVVLVFTTADGSEPGTAVEIDNV